MENSDNLAAEMAQCADCSHGREWETRRRCEECGAPICVFCEDRHNHEIVEKHAELPPVTQDVSCFWVDGSGLGPLEMQKQIRAEIVAMRPLRIREIQQLHVSTRRDGPDVEREIMLLLWFDK